MNTLSVHISNMYNTIGFINQINRISNLNKHI